MGSFMKEPVRHILEELKNGTHIKKNNQYPRF